MQGGLSPQSELVTFTNLPTGPWLDLRLHRLRQRWPRTQRSPTVLSALIQLARLALCSSARIRVSPPSMKPSPPRRKCPESSFASGRSVYWSLLHYVVANNAYSPQNLALGSAMRLSSCLKSTTNRYASFAMRSPTSPIQPSQNCSARLQHRLLRLWWSPSNPSS